jgi:hypothetical protein
MTICWRRHTSEKIWMQDPEHVLIMVQELCSLLVTIFFYTEIRPSAMIPVLKLLMVLLLGLMVDLLGSIDSDTMPFGLISV